MLLRPQNSGVGGCILGLARALASAGVSHRLTLYAREDIAGLQLAWSRCLGGAEVSLAPSFAAARAGRVLWEQLGLPARARADRIDVFHAPGYVGPLRAPCPVVVTIHDLFAFTHPAMCTELNRAHYRALLPASVRRAALIVVHSAQVARDVQTLLRVPARRIRVVPPGIDPEFRRRRTDDEQLRVRARHGIGSRFILFAGNREPKKNLARLIDAFAVVHQRIPELELVVAGSRVWRSKKRLLLRAHPAVREIGWIAPGDLPTLFQAARAVAFPSLVEGFGLPVIEAMASGTPVVASAVPAVVESDPNAVVRVNPHDVDDIASGLERAILDESLRAALRVRAERAARAFTWERAAAEMWALYEDAAG